VLRANLSVRFAAELAAYAGLAYGGASVPAAFGLRVVSAAVAPVATAGLWWRFLSPRARRRLRDPSALICEVVVFAGAGALVALAGARGFGIVLAVVGCANAGVLRLIGGLDAGMPVVGRAVAGRLVAGTQDGAMQGAGAHPAGGPQVGEPIASAAR
jgi:Protein of unknown function (DUF2568)